MRRLTDEERMALVEVGTAGEGPVSDATFTELARLGYGYWAVGESFWDRLTRQTYWRVTAKGREALALDTIAKAAGG
jgi:hypothetical protein